MGEKKGCGYVVGGGGGPKIKKKDLNFIRKPESRKRIKQHNHYQKVIEEYNKIWNNSFPVFNPRVILLERKLKKLSYGQRKFFLKDLIKIPSREKYEQ